jgi:hypothetical protein
LSDARRSILHRQERDALAVLAAKRDGVAGALAAQAQANLLLRADLLELAALKQSRDINAVSAALTRHAGLIDQLAGSVAGGPAGRPDDPRHVENLNARLEAVELWILRTAPAPG